MTAQAVILFNNSDMTRTQISHHSKHFPLHPPNFSAYSTRNSYLEEIMTASQHKEFLENVLERIVETVAVYSMVESSHPKGVFKLRSCFCGFELEMIENDDDTFAELNCWLMESEDVALDVSVYETEHVTALTDAVQSNFRWCKIFRENDTMAVYRSEWLTSDYEDRDIHRIAHMVQHVVAEIEHLHPIVVQLLFQGPSVCNAEAVDLFLETPTTMC